MAASGLVCGHGPSLSLRRDCSSSSLLKNGLFPAVNPGPRLGNERSVLWSVLRSTGGKRPQPSGFRRTTLLSISASVQPAPDGELLDVAIVGGGPAGLATALALRAAAPQLKVEVFERAPELKALGWGLGLAPNGMYALKAIHPSLSKKMFSRYMKDGPIHVYGVDGTLLMAVDSNMGVFAGGDPECVGGFLPWYKLQQGLAEELPPGQLHLGQVCEGLEQTEDEVHLRFAGAGTVRARIVIGADGTHSAVRRFTLNDGPPEFLNAVVWRGLCAPPEDWAFGDIHRLGWKCAELPGYLTLVVNSDKDTLAWQYMGPWSAADLPLLGRSREVEGGSEGDKGKKERALTAFSGPWPSIVTELIERTDVGKVTEHPYFCREPEQCQQWVSGRVALVGDAAHLMTAFTGQGVNQTLVDTVELARTIGELGPCPEALDKYQAIRLPVASKVQGGSVNIAKNLFLKKIGVVSELAWMKENMDVLVYQSAPLAAPVAVK